MLKPIEKKPIFGSKFLSFSRGAGPFFLVASVLAVGGKIAIDSYFPSAPLSMNYGQIIIMVLAFGLSVSWIIHGVQLLIIKVER